MEKLIELFHPVISMGRSLHLGSLNNLNLSHGAFGQHDAPGILTLRLKAQFLRSNTDGPV